MWQAWFIPGKQPNCWGKWGTIRRKGNMEDFLWVLLDLRAMLSWKLARFLSRDSWRQAYTWGMEKDQGTWRTMSVTSRLLQSFLSQRLMFCQCQAWKHSSLNSCYNHIHFLVTFTLLSCSLHKLSDKITQVCLIAYFCSYFQHLHFFRNNYKLTVLILEYPD